MCALCVCVHVCVCERENVRERVKERVCMNGLIDHDLFNSSANFIKLVKDVTDPVLQEHFMKPKY